MSGPGECLGMVCVRVVEVYWRCVGVGEGLVRVGGCCGDISIMCRTLTGHIDHLNSP